MRGSARAQPRCQPLSTGPAQPVAGSRTPHKVRRLAGIVETFPYSTEDAPSPMQARRPCPSPPGRVECRLARRKRAKTRL